MSDSHLTNLYQVVAEDLVRLRKLAPSPYWFEVINDFILHLVEMFKNSPNFDQEEFLTACEMEKEWRKL